MVNDLLYWLCLICAGLAVGMSLVLIFHTSVTGRQTYRIPKHIVPLAISYTFLAALIGVRVYLRSITDPLLIAAAAVALGIGIWGLWIAIESRSKAKSDS
jgi:hypothetical protein